MARVIAIIAPLAIIAGLGVGGTFVLQNLKPKPEKAEEAKTLRDRVFLETSSILRRERGCRVS